MDLISQKNEILFLSNKLGWECVQVYSRNPTADDSIDEKKIKKALKEAKIDKEEKIKTLRTSRKSSHHRQKSFSSPCLWLTDPVLQ